MTKKLSAAIICCALALALTAGCKGSDKPSPSAPEEQTPSASPSETPAAEISLSELYSLDGEYTDGVGNVYAYSYHVPQIDGDTEDARRINDELKNGVGYAVERELEAMRGGYSLSLARAGWEQSAENGVVSVRVETCYDDDFTDYYTFRYDFNTGAEVTLKQTLAELGIAEEAFLTRARAIAESAFSDAWGSAPSDEFWRDRHDWTLSEENLNLQMKFFVEEGRLTLILPIGSPAGSGWYYHLLPF